MTKLDEVRKQLADLEMTKQHLTELVEEQKNLVGELNSQKKQLFEIKTSFDRVVAPFVEGLLKLDSIQSEIKKAGQTLRVAMDLIPIEKFYAYLGNLSSQDKSQVIHEDIAPSVLGFQIWNLLRKKGK